ncbi:MAG: hydroxymethylpyrimidine/phosphomethylpyrimidine kinase [Bacteroidota bacterium]
MTKTRPYVLSIAGFDPSGGAGVLADIKTFEANKVYGFGVVSALTFQNDTDFEKVEWVPLEKIIEQVSILQKRFQFEYIKIGLIENLEILNQLILHLNSNISNPKIIWDPILKASAGFDFHDEINKKLLEVISKNSSLVTPNFEEIKKLTDEEEEKNAAKKLSKYCNVFLKGGHNENDLGRDFLFTTDGKEFSFRAKQKLERAKHGSGCVLSSAITANLAKGFKLHRACMKAKQYTAEFLNSNKDLLGYHKI